MLRSTKRNINTAGSMRIAQYFSELWFTLAIMISDRSSSLAAAGTVTRWSDAEKQAENLNNCEILFMPVVFGFQSLSPSVVTKETPLPDQSKTKDTTTLSSLSVERDNSFPKDPYIYTLQHNVHI